MSHRRAERLYAALLLSASLILLVSVFSARYFPVQSDETHLAWVGKQAARGLVPYGDYFTYFPPVTVYLLGALFKLFGASLHALRLFMVLWLTGVTFLLFRLFVRSGVGPGWAAAFALQLPALLLPYWPVPSHHWFSLGFALAALLAARPGGDARRWALAGFLAGLSGLCVQTLGALACFLLMAALLREGWSPRTRRLALWAAAGVALPLGLSALILALQGAMGWAWYDLVTWPAKYYKRPGGFNDVKTTEFILTMLAEKLPHGWSPVQVGPLLTFCTALALPLLCVTLLAFSPAWLDGRSGSRRAWLWSLAAAGATVLVFQKGRADWTHLLFYAPLLLVVAAEEVDWSGERLRPGALKTWAALAVVIALARWPLFWVRTPPLVTDVVAADAVLVRHGLPASVTTLPDVVQKRQPVLAFPDGCTLYLYWEPVPVPLDWVMAPASGVEAPWEYERLAAFAREHRVPYIIVRRGQVGAYLDQPSALADCLHREYRFLRETPWGTLFERIPDGPASR